jgi:hypothetical protein
VQCEGGGSGVERGWSEGVGEEWENICLRMNMDVNESKKRKL